MPPKTMPRMCRFAYEGGAAAPLDASKPGSVHSLRQARCKTPSPPLEGRSRGGGRGRSATPWPSSKGSSSSRRLVPPAPAISAAMAFGGRQDTRPRCTSLRRPSPRTAFASLRALAAENCLSADDAAALRAPPVRTRLRRATRWRCWTRTPAGHLGPDERGLAESTSAGCSGHWRRCTFCTAVLCGRFNHTAATPWAVLTLRGPTVHAKGEQAPVAHGQV